MTMGLQKKLHSGVQPPVPFGARPARPASRRAFNIRTAHVAAGDRIFTDKTGGQIKVLGYDYGFRSGAGRLYTDGDGEVPESIWDLAASNFRHELAAMRRFVRCEGEEMMEDGHNTLQKVLFALGTAGVKLAAAVDLALESAGALPELKKPPAATAEEKAVKAEFRSVLRKLRQLKLSNRAVMEEEEKRVLATARTKSPWYIKLPYLVLCIVLDITYDGRPIQRFWVLETVARIPYFAYISMLHLYETLGWWRAGAELRKIHFAEEWNELHHLQIMEALGGDQLWIDRFVAQHAGLVYYWVLIVFFMLSPRNAYNFSELVEFHATDTYTVFAETNKEMLQAIAPPRVAVNYYRNEDLYMFDEISTSSDRVEPRRPICDNLYDVFINIRDDEIEHVKTMKACQTKQIVQDVASRKARTLPK